MRQKQIEKIEKGFPWTTVVRRKGNSIRKKDWFNMVSEYRFHLQGKYRCRGQFLSLPGLKEAITAHLGADSFREFHLSDMKGQPTVGF